MKALIVGAGIAGLATGIAMRQAGLQVEIFERSASLQEIGAGLMIWPNGARSLQALGVTIDALRVRHLSICSWRGRILNRYPLESISDRYGFDPCFVHRADLHSALVDRFGGDGIHLGVEVSGFQEDADGLRVLARNGSAVRGDLLIGADGLRSAVRRQLLGDGDPTYLGSTIWRGIVQGNGVLIEPESGINWVGRGSEFLAFQLRGDRIYWAGVSKEPRGEKAGTGGHKGDLMARFGTWATPVPELIASTDESAILRNDMYDRRPSNRWSGGRVVLVGDAAHPTTPNAGQGACQALEDGVVLGDSFKQCDDLVSAFALYERRRMRRANRVVALSHQATRAVQLENPFLCALRDVVGSFVARRIFLRALHGILSPES
jgi:2-polyprenyl-6-methoxyphenol hydroxylase-like FAD-dependent oxidoreductase